MFKVVQKKVFQTMNSNGQKRTVMNIVDKSQNKEVRTRAISMKQNPKDFLIVQQGIKKDGRQIVPFQKLYHMKEKDIHDLFSSAEGVSNKNLTNFGAKEIKIKSMKKINNNNNNNTKINLMEKEISSMSEKLKQLKKHKKDKGEKKIKAIKSKDTKKSSKKILKLKSKKLKGGNKDGEVIGFDPHGNDWAPFQTVEQDKMMKTMQKGGLKEIITPEVQQHMADSLKLSIDSKTPGTPFKTPELKIGGKHK